MDQSPLEVYRIDMKYVRNLHNIDDRVLSVSPQIGKDERPSVKRAKLRHYEKIFCEKRIPVAENRTGVISGTFAICEGCRRVTYHIGYAFGCACVPPVLRKGWISQDR